MRTYSKSGNEDCQLKKTQSLLQEAQRGRGDYVNHDKDWALRWPREAWDAVRAGGTANHSWGREDSILGEIFGIESWRKMKVIQLQKGMKCGLAKVHHICKVREHWSKSWVLEWASAGGLVKDEVREFGTRLWNTFQAIWYLDCFYILKLFIWKHSQLYRKVERTERRTFLPESFEGKLPTWCLNISPP